eukprot:COSAG01_NODE_2129_length_8368_cov_15.044041_4_plen_75_part_00
MPKLRVQMTDGRLTAALTACSRLIRCASQLGCAQYPTRCIRLACYLVYRLRFIIITIRTTMDGLRVAYDLRYRY